jgi:hypothetical protein
VYAAEIQEKTPEDVEKYYNTFVEKWTTLAGQPVTTGRWVYVAYINVQRHPESKFA